MAAWWKNDLIAEQITERLRRSFTVRSRGVVTEDCYVFTATCGGCGAEYDKPVDGMELVRVRDKKLHLESWLEMLLVECIRDYPPCECAPLATRLAHREMYGAVGAQRPPDKIVVYGGSFWNDSPRSRKERAIALVNKALHAGKVGTNEDQQEDFEGEEPTHDADAQRLSGDEQARREAHQERRDDEVTAAAYPTNLAEIRQVIGHGEWSRGYLLDEQSGKLAEVFGEPKDFDVGASDDMAIVWFGTVTGPKSADLTVEDLLKAQEDFLRRASEGYGMTAEQLAMSASFKDARPSFTASFTVTRYGHRVEVDGLDLRGVDGLTARECLQRYEEMQRNDLPHDVTRALTPKQVELARWAWQVELKRKVQASKKRERNQVLVDIQDID